MFTGQQVAGLLSELGITHVTTVPDSTIGPWFDDIAAANIDIVQVCREGEAWAIAAGLHLGGASPLVLIWFGPVVLRRYSLPAANCSSGEFNRPSLRRVRQTVDSETLKPWLSVIQAAS